MIILKTSPVRIITIPAGEEGKRQSAPIRAKSNRLIVPRFIKCSPCQVPHWNTFLSTVQKYYNALTGKAIAPKTEPAGRTYTVGHGDTFRQIAQTLLDKGSRCTEIVKLNGLKSNVLMSGQVLVLPEK